MGLFHFIFLVFALRAIFMSLHERCSDNVVSVCRLTGYRMLSGWMEIRQIKNEFMKSGISEGYLHFRLMLDYAC